MCLIAKAYVIQTGDPAKNNFTISIMTLLHNKVSLKTNFYAFIR